MVKEVEGSQEKGKSESSGAKSPEEPVTKEAAEEPAPKAQEDSHDSPQELAPLPDSPKADPAHELSAPDHVNDDAGQKS